MPLSSLRASAGPLLLALSLSACASAPAVAPAAPPPASVAAPPAPAPAVARIDGAPISAAELEAHRAATQLAPEDAREDLIDLTLLRAAAGANGVVLVAPLSAEARTAAEYQLARKLGLEVPAASDLLVVDHVWVKDAAKPKPRAAQKVALERLRALVVAGTPIPAAYAKVVTDGSAWHVGDHEEYPYEVVPAAAHDLAAGALSPIIPGDGGLHLFTIHARKQVLPAADVVRPALRGRLREGKNIELIELGGPPAGS